VSTSAGLSTAERKRAQQRAPHQRALRWGQFVLPGVQDSFPGVLVQQKSLQPLVVSGSLQEVDVSDMLRKHMRINEQNERDTSFRNKQQASIWAHRASQTHTFGLQL